MGEVVAVVSQYPKSPKDKVILYGELLYTCREIMSEFDFSRILWMKWLL